MLQFQMQGQGINVPSQLLTALPYGHHRGAGADFT